MRSKKDAPVDILGPEAQYDTRNEGKNKHFSILVGLLLSVQTRDEMTGKTMIKLRENNFDLQKALTMEESEIEKLISEVNYKTKKAQ
jgi:endonuclease III